jgi:hypothetical protein
MNLELAAVNVASAGTKTREIWQDYSSPWQACSVGRAVAALVLVLTGRGLQKMRRS